MDNVLSVSQLSQYTQSTSSFLTGARIIGRITICDQGSLVLHDTNNTDCVIDGRSDRFHHDLQGMIVLITQWQWIKANDPTFQSLPWIEFLFQSVFRVGSDTPVLQQIVREDELAVCLFRANTRTAIKGQDDDAPIHMAVQISSKSVLFGNRFVLGFTPVASADEEEDRLKRQRTLRTIVFQGENLIPYYLDYSIGMFYLFVNLKIDPMNKHCVEFVEHRSCGYMLTKAEYDAFISPRDNRPAISSSPFTHTGVVTRVIDPFFGIYELDHQTITCFFHCFNYNFMHPYRMGTHLRISTFHVLRLDTTAALNHYWGIRTKDNGDPDAHHFMIVACLCSHIQTSAFPDVTSEQPLCAKSIFGTSSFPEIHYLFRDCCLTRSNFPCLLQKLELHASLHQKLHQRLGDELLNLVVLDAVHCLLGRPDTGDGNYGKFGDIIGDIFQHDRHCSAMGEHQTIISPVLYQVPPLEVILKKVMAKKDQLERVLYNHTMVPNTPELKNVDLAQYDFPFDQASMNTFVLGIIESSDEDGQLYFVDDTYRIPIVLQSADALPPIGDLYLLKKFRLIEEDLSYTHITGDTVQLYSTYIVCKVSDMLRVAHVASRSQPSLRVSPALAEAVHHFTEATGEGEKEGICMLFIKNKRPITLSLSDDNEPLLVAHANAMCYAVKGRSNDEDNISPPIEVDLMMQTGNLRYWPQLKIGNWYALVGGTVVHLLGPARDTCIPKQAIRTYRTYDISRFITEKSKLKHNFQPILSVDSDTCLLRVDELNGTDDVNHLCSFLPSTVMHFTPVSYASENTASPPAGPTRPVYQVTDVLRPDQNDGPNMQVIQDRYFQDLIHVQGIVISKMFCETQITRAEAYERAEELYRRLGVGTGQASRTILIRLRQINGLDTFDIYVNMTSRPYPLGIIPGALVSFYNLVRRQHATGGIYGQAMMSTTIEVSPTMDLQGAFARDLIPRRHLAAIRAEMIQSMTHTVFRSDCTIQRITRLSLKWVCALCGSVVSNYGCYNLCKQARWVFVAEATVDVMDGTAEARLFIESDEHVIRLLHLSSNTIETLKETALEHGILTYDSWIAGDRSDELMLPTRSTQCTSALESLCRSQISQPLRIYGRVISKKSRTYRNSNNIVGDLKMVIKQVNDEVNDPFLTVSLPQLHIKVLELELLDPADAAWSFLKRSK